MELHVFFVSLNQPNLSILHLDQNNFVLPHVPKFHINTFSEDRKLRKQLNITYFLLILLFSISKLNF